MMRSVLFPVVVRLKVGRGLSINIVVVEGLVIGTAALGDVAVRFYEGGV